MQINGASWINHINYFESIDSSNTYLMRSDQPVHGRVCITDYQTLGKGRRGRQWISSAGGNLLFSLGWTPKKPQGSEVGLVVGVAIADVLSQMGLDNVTLKWPNDVLVKGEKLVGILLESRVRGKQVELVIGVGLNVKIDPAELGDIETPWVDLARLGKTDIHRQTLLVKLLSAISMRLEQFEIEGFAPIRADWLAYHAMDGIMVSYELAGQIKTGTIMSLDLDGGLLLESNGETVKVSSGEIHTLREVT